MSKAEHITECPYPMPESQRKEIEETAEEMGVSDIHVFSVVIQEGLEKITGR